MTDYISRKMTIDAICRLCNANFEEDPCEPSECEMMSLLRKIPAADAIEELSKPRWIPVTERLPEDDTGVLAHVYWPKYGDTMVCYGHWHKGWCHLYHHVEGELISGYVVTHWMPLPQPPKEG